jgi:hypothetical protein
MTGPMTGMMPVPHFFSGKRDTKSEAPISTTYTGEEHIRESTVKDVHNHLGPVKTTAVSIPLYSCHHHERRRKSEEEEQ